MDWQVQVAPGDGVVARTGGSLVVALPATPAQETFVDSLLDALRLGAGEPGADSARRLARRTAALVAGAEPDDVPSFGLLSATDGGVAALLVGEAELTITGPAGEERVSGRDATTWVDRLVREPFERLALSVTPGATPDPRSRLGDGVVRGSGVALGGTAAAPVAAAPAPVKAKVSPPAKAARPAKPPAPAKASAPAKAPPPAKAAAAAKAPPPPPSPVEVGARATAETPAVVADFTSVSLADPLPDEELVPLPLLGEPAAAEGVQVKGIACSHGHFNDPSSIYCATCGISMVHQTHNLVAGTRPPLGVLVVDDGSVFTLTEDYVVGREPENSDDVQAKAALPLPLEDPDQTLSRVHAKILLDGWEVRVVDVHSANGTFVARPGETDWTRLVPGEPTTIRPGTRINVGGRSLVFDSHRKL